MERNSEPNFILPDLVESEKYLKVLQWENEKVSECRLSVLHKTSEEMNHESLNKDIRRYQFCKTTPDIKRYTKKFRMIENFILPALNCGKYGRLLQWENKEAGIFSVYYKHLNDGSWNAEDFRVFTDYQKIKNRTISEDISYSKSKRRFKTSLDDVRYVKQIKSFYRNVQRYQLMSKVYHIQIPKRNTI